MTISNAVIFIIVAAIAGYLFGLLDSRFTAALRKKPEKPNLAIQDAAPREINRPGEQTVMMVCVDKDQKWHVDLDGVRLANPGEISLEQRQKLVNTIVQIRPWLEGKPVQAPAPVAAPLPAAASPAAARMPAKAPDMPSQPSAIQGALKVSPIRGISSMVSQDVRSAGEKKPASIVAMIDDVLQAKLSGTPLKDKGIKLEDGLMGGVIVCVGSQRYEGVGSVPDPEIRAIIQAAISDWEKR